MLWRVPHGLTAVALALSTAACSSGDASVTRDRFAAAMQERYAVDDEQADCITGHVFDDYDRAAVRTLFDDGVTGLPQALWDPFLQSVIGCTIPDGSLEP